MKARLFPLALPSVVWQAFLASRLLNLVFVYLGHVSHPFQEKLEGGYVGVSNWYLNPWTYYDSNHFLSIASRGYTLETTPFFPLYPLLMRPFGPNENAMALAGIIISNLAFFGALWLFYALTRRDYSEKIAPLAVWILALFPMSVCSLAVYTESLFLLLGIACWWFTGQKKWFLAALFGALAALTRNAGPIMSLALLWWWFEASRQEKKWDWRSALAALTPMFAFVGLQLYFKWLFSASAATLSAQSNYHRSVTIPFWPFIQDLIEILGGANRDVVTILNAAFTLAAFAVLVWKHKKIRRADAILLVGILALHLTIARNIPPYTNGSLRYLFGLWPASQIFALAFCDTKLMTIVTERPVSRAIVILLGCLSTALMAYCWGQRSFLG